MTWSEAKNLCKTKGGKLVEIDSEEENTALVDEIKRKGYNIYPNPRIRLSVCLCVCHQKPPSNTLSTG